MSAGVGAVKVPEQLYSTTVEWSGFPVPWLRELSPRALSLGEATAFARAKLQDGQAWLEAGTDARAQFARALAKLVGVQDGSAPGRDSSIEIVEGSQGGPFIRVHFEPVASPAPGRSRGHAR